MTPPTLRTGSVSSPSTDESLSQSTSPGASPMELALTVPYLRHQRDFPSPPPSMSIPSDRLLDMKLFHHYMDMTRREEAVMMDSANKYAVNGAKIVWSNWIISLAVETPHLMEALLAFSAFHLRHLTDPDKSLTKAAHTHMLRAITEHSNQVSKGITSENAEVVFATSTFIAFHATSESIVPAGYDENSLVHWFQPWHGIRSVIDLCWEHIRSPEIQTLIKYENTAEQINQVEPEDPDKFNFLLDGLGDSSEPSLDEETRHAYTTSVHYLNKLSRAAFARHVLKFTGLVSKRFVELVLMKDPRALAIVGYHLMMILQLNQVWWLQGSAERDFAVVLQNLPKSWLPMMEPAIQTFRETPSLAKKRVFN
ncbi:hypothetical protein GLAREA_01385 [Glarea lozoyensis ATCC 20868]|uniref:Uncharacterized protein n=1 Tax=Glarea lozoyensis (strain ATCC 20868 / MF5171) TaxID=1116229 RepID=S3DFQ1_GLAL2|nr:uncharacterized protein GLAREA_01385 [Glarea lozoyensis ATCC 20868]EPE25473.1 hypothetical protein GLAREA_01385 [Glarea lozoyensis ATCC 20868]